MEQAVYGPHPAIKLPLPPSSLHPLWWCGHSQEDVRRAVHWYEQKCEPIVREYRDKHFEQRPEYNFAVVQYEVFLGSRVFDPKNEYMICWLHPIVETLHLMRLFALRALVTYRPVRVSHAGDEGVLVSFWPGEAIIARGAH